MQDKINILIVEDEGLVAMELEESLLNEGYNVIDIADNCDDACEAHRKQNADLILLDINIKGNYDGIETATRLMEIKEVPFIYLTAFTDAPTLDRAKKTFPAAYLSKPYQVTNLTIAIEMALHNFAFRKAPGPKMQVVDWEEKKEKPAESRESILSFNNSIFVKQNYKFIKIDMGDIYYLEADSNYTYIYTVENKYAIRHSLQNVMDKLMLSNFVRTHRSYAVNINHLTTFNDSFVNIGNYEIPLGRNYKESFFKYFNFL
jgi:DNA-binding LytR/AlgR family response regulator